MKIAMSGPDLTEAERRAVRQVLETPTLSIVFFFKQKTAYEMRT